MRLLCVDIFRHTGSETPPVRLANASDLSTFSYWSRGTIGEHLNFACRTVCQRTGPGQRQTVEQKGDNPFLVHVYVRSDGLSATVVADKEYPQRVAFSFINKIFSDFEKKAGEGWKRIDTDQEGSQAWLQSILNEFQDPKTADKLLKIQDTLDDIKEIMHKNIEEVLKRGETIDGLVAKSQDLSESSKIFYKQAKKQNQCCKAW